MYLRTTKLHAAAVHFGRLYELYTNHVVLILMNGWKQVVVIEMKLLHFLAFFHLPYDKQLI